MNLSVTEMVMQKGTYTAEEAEELQVALGGGLSVVRDNTLEVIRRRQLQQAQGQQGQGQDGKKPGQGQKTEAELKARLVQQQAAFRQEQEGKGKAAAAAGVAAAVGPLPPGWQEVKDPGSSEVYYWYVRWGSTRAECNTRGGWVMGRLVV